MLNACLDKRLFPPAPIWSTILLLLSANAVAGAPLHANDDGTSSSSVMNSMQTAPLLISTVLRKENADAVQCEPPAVSASKGHCMCPQGTACSGSEQCRGGVSVTTKQHVSGYLQNCAGCTCTALGKGGGGWWSQARSTGYYTGACRGSSGSGSITRGNFAPRVDNDSCHSPVRTTTRMQAPENSSCVSLHLLYFYYYYPRRYILTPNTPTHLHNRICIYIKHSENHSLDCWSRVCSS